MRLSLMVNFIWLEICWVRSVQVITSNISNPCVYVCQLEKYSTISQKKKIRILQQKLIRSVKIKNNDDWGNGIFQKFYVWWILANLEIFEQQSVDKNAVNTWILT